jgi:hypothetical protein
VGGGTRRTQLSAPRAFEKSFKKSARTFFFFFIFLFFPLFFNVLFFALAVLLFSIGLLVAFYFF